MVTGLPRINLSHKTCEGFLFGNQSRKNFKNSVLQRAKKPLEVVYSDVCGLLDNNSLGGNRYFLTFVDEFTRKIWIYLLKEKCEVFGRFVNFFAKVEMQSSHALTIYRTNGGEEFNSKELEDFVLQKEFNMKLQLLTLHNIMELQREEIELCLIWQGACSKARGLLIAVGERLSPLQPIFSLGVLQKN